MGVFVYVIGQSVRVRIYIVVVGSRYLLSQTWVRVHVAAERCNRDRVGERVNFFARVVVPPGNLTYLLSGS